MSSTRGLFTAVLVLALATLFSVSMPMSPSSASGDSADDPLITGQDRSEEVDLDALEDAELTDLGTVAEQEGISVEDAAREFAWQEPFSALVDELRTEFPDDFAGARIEQADGADAWVAFRGDAPDEALELLAGFERQIAVHEQRGFTEAEIDDAVVDAHFEVRDHDDVADVVTGRDLAEGQIEIDVTPASGVDADEVVVTFEDAIEPANSDITVEVQSSGEIDYADETIYGGGHLSTCTASFVVTNGSTRGVGTAAHCGNAQSYFGDSLTFMSEHNGSWGDFQWHRHTSRAHEPRFYSDYPTSRPVHGVGTATEGQSLCKYGKTTGYGCEQVLSVNECQGDSCRLVAMQSHITDGGDSGGPWFWNNTAYGVHKGWKSISGVQRSTFSQAHLMSNAIGVSVVTQ